MRPLAAIAAVVALSAPSLARSAPPPSAPACIAGGPFTTAWSGYVPHHGGPKLALRTITRASDGSGVIGVRGIQGQTVYPGRDLGNGKIEIDMRGGPGWPNVTCVGQFSNDCGNLTWSPACGPSESTSWCAAWTPGCDSPPHEYGTGFNFSSVFGDNMVLQQGPAKAAVYGVAAGLPTGIKVTVNNVDTGESYDVDATVGVNATHQPYGPDYEYIDAECTGRTADGGAGCTVPIPFVSWKVLLKPAPAGGNYTIVATCAGCTQAGAPSSVSISDVTFGDVFHCTGQSNMWLPVDSAFGRNDTIGNITKLGKYRNIRGMFGVSGFGFSVDTNPWKTALQATPLAPALSQATAPNGSAPHTPGHFPILWEIGAACWFFAQALTDQLEKAGKVVPIGITDSAIGGQRIEQFAPNGSLSVCENRLGGVGSDSGVKARADGGDYAKNTLPFVDMTIKGWVWYQGENNMFGVKGNSVANQGYSCEMREFVRGYRRVWSETPGTTSPNAPFGIVTLASSGSEGGPNMGGMRLAQTAGYGVAPNEALPNTFLAQAYDLDDEWPNELNPCATAWACCSGRNHVYNATACNNGTKNNRSLCDLACEIAVWGPPERMGGIHPRSKKPVGDRLGAAAFAVVYGGQNAYTGPTLSGCSVSASPKELVIRFNASLLRGDGLVVSKTFPPLTYQGKRHPQPAGGTQLFVQTNASLFCLEPMAQRNATSGKFVPGTDYCPTWAGGSGPSEGGVQCMARGGCQTDLDTNWTMLPFKQTSATAITVDLTPLGGKTPTAVRYAWGIIDCCDYTDPTLFVTHGCIANCPIYSSSGLPANPFQAQIVGGKCKCVASQVCDA